MNGTWKTIGVALEAMTAGYIAGMTQAAEVTSRFGVEVEKTRLQAEKPPSAAGWEAFATKTETVGARMTKSLTVPILAFGAAAVAAAVQYDGAIHIIEQRTGATGAKLQGLKKDFDAVNATSGASMSHIADVMSQANQRLGLTGAPLQAFTKDFLVLERVAGTGAPTIEQATTVMVAWKVATGDQASTLDKLFVASQRAGVPLNSLIDDVTRFAPQMRLAGLSIDQTTVFMASLEKAGAPVSKVMAGVNSFMARAGQEGPNALQKIIAKAAEMDKTVQGAHDATVMLEDTTTGFGKKAGPVMAQLIKDGRLYGPVYDALARSVAGAGGEIQKVGDATMPLGTRMKQAEKSIEMAFVPFGQVILPEIMSGLHGVAVEASKVGGEFGKLPKPVQEWTLGLLAAAAAAGPVLTLVSKVRGAFAVDSVLMKSSRTMKWFVEDLGTNLGVMRAGFMAAGTDAETGFAMMRAGAAGVLETLAPLGAALLVVEGAVGIFQVATGWDHAAQKADKYAVAQLRTEFGAKTLHAAIAQSVTDYDRLSAATDKALRFTPGNIWGNGWDAITGKTPRAVKAVDDWNASLGKMGSTLDSINTAGGRLGLTPEQVYGWMQVLKIDPAQLVKTANGWQLLTSKIGAAQAQIVLSAQASGASQKDATKQLTDWQQALTDTDFVKAVTKNFGDVSTAQSKLAAESTFMGLSFKQGLAAFTQSPKDFEASRQAILKLTNTVHSAVTSSGDLTSIPADLVKSQSGIKKWMSDTLMQNATFASDLAKAGGRGLNSDAMAQLIVAGPQKAAPILHELLKSSGNDMIAQFNTFSAQIMQQADLAAAQARIVAIATDPHYGSAQKAADVGRGVQLATMLQLKPMTLAEVQAATGLTPKAISRIMGEFQLPPLKPTIDPNVDLARQMRNIDKWTHPTMAPVLHIDATVDLVEQKLLAMRYKINAADAAMTIDGIPVKAIEKLTSTKVKVDSTTGRVTLDAKQQAALLQLEAVKNAINSGRGWVNIDADTAAALAKLGDIRTTINGIPFVGSVLAATLFAHANAAEVQRAAVGQKHLAAGGYVHGPNVHADVVPAMLMPGEVVVKKSSVDRFGLGSMLALNDGRIPPGWIVPRKYAAGGVVDGNAVAAPAISALNSFVTWEQAVQAQKMAAAAAASGGGSSGAPYTGGQALLDRVLWTIRQTESGNNYAARNPTSTASGAYQFLDSTWHGYGGFPRAYLAPAGVQDARAGGWASQILGSFPGDIKAVPITWYTGHYTPGQALGTAADGGSIGGYVRKWEGNFDRTGPQVNGFSDGGVVWHGRNFDAGGPLWPGWNAVRNDTGRVEHVVPTGPGGSYGGHTTIDARTYVTVSANGDDSVRRVVHEEVIPAIDKKYTELTAVVRRKESSMS